ncbi:PREDICTED: paired immunoglobulin-like type 2 receptor alpha [Chinchilla lanigera]|uniref:paired immunoglobulin-like type 2 receptor alpha n=1 Tax=Chinchilla lanigera TaxID=34839 RepID=UPI00038EB097|nr:PREDICTED: paired immunoglobulin-like type 2 receptor alpha [Chinchilla lanigera]
MAPKTTRAGLQFTGGKSSEPPSLSFGAIVGVAVAATIALIAIIVGLMVFLKWQRKKGQQVEAQSPAGELVESTENYENTKYEEKHKDAQLNPQNDIVYASVTLSNLTSPRAPLCQPSHETPQEEILYTLLKT